MVLGQIKSTINISTLAGCDRNNARTKFKNIKQNENHSTVCGVCGNKGIRTAALNAFNNKLLDTSST